MPIQTVRKRSMRELSREVLGQGATIVMPEMILSQSSDCHSFERLFQCSECAFCSPYSVEFGLGIKANL
jgi:hypothetical protein